MRDLDQGSWRRGRGTMRDLAQGRHDHGSLVYRIYGLILDQKCRGMRSMNGGGRKRLTESIIESFFDHVCMSNG